MGAAILAASVDECIFQLPTHCTVYDLRVSDDRERRKKFCCFL